MAKPVSLIDTARQIEQAPCVAAVRDTLLAAAAAFGLSGVAIIDISLVGRSRRGKLLLNTFPESFSREYVQTRAIEHDPHVDMALRTWKAFRWIGLDGEFKCQKARAVIELGARHGLLEGLGAGVLVPTGARALLVMGGDRLDISPQDLTAFPLLALYARCRLGELASESNANSPRLSRREADCLRWAAQGKTSWEIAQILAISQHTADSYLNSAARKLRATNRIQAVAEAFRRGVIV